MQSNLELKFKMCYNNFVEKCVCVCVCVWGGAWHMFGAENATEW